MISIAAFTLFSAWMTSVPYEGRALYALATYYGINLGSLMQAAIGALVLGLLCGIFVRSQKSAKAVLLFSGSVCLAGSFMLFLPSFSLWSASLLIVSFSEGLWTAVWGWFFKTCTPPGFRIKTAAACLSVSALLAIGVDLAAVFVSPLLGLTLATLLLAGSVAAAAGLPVQPQAEAAGEEDRSDSKPPKGAMALLCLFILIITIDSGFMFSVVNPAFADLSSLTTWYWNIPYIAAVIIVSGLSKTVRRSFVLYTAITAIGLSFIAFLTLGHSAGAYLVVDTLLLGACGVNDLFWWSILGEMLTGRPDPSKIMGIGLAANVGGVLIGELIAGVAENANSSYITSLAGLTVVCLSFIILPILQNKLFAGAVSEPFGIQAADRTQSGSPPDPVIPGAGAAHEDDSAGPAILQGLTERERQIYLLLLKGYTRQLIAAELLISEATVKTHISNIYAKLGVKNKTELIRSAGNKSVSG